MENEKIIIIGPNNINQYKSDLANLIVSKNSDLSIMNTFVTDDSLQQNVNSCIDYIYYIPYVKVQEAYKNASVLYCSIDELNNDITHGIMMDEYYNNDIMYLEFIDFNNISDNVFVEDNKTSQHVIIWLDTNSVNENNNAFKRHEDVRESKYVYQRIEKHNIPCLYFNIDKEHISNISNIILNYYNTTDIEKRNQIIFENS